MTDNDSRGQQKKKKKTKVAPRARIALGKGDVVVDVCGDESTTFSEVVHAAHNEIQHFSEDNVFVEDKRPEVIVVDPSSDKEDW